MSVSASKLHQAFLGVLTDCKAKVPTHKAIEPAYNEVLAILDKHGFVCMPRVLSHEFKVSSSRTGGAIGFTTVHTEFGLFFSDGNILTLSGVGVHQSEDQYLSNGLLKCAQRVALLSVFLLPAVVKQITTPPESTDDPANKAQAVAAQMNREKGGVAQTLTADQLKPGPSPEQKAAARKELDDWRVGITRLDSKQPGQWDQHLVKIGSLPMLKEHNRVELMNELIQAGYQAYVDYDPETQKFKLAPVPEVAA